MFGDKNWLIVIILGGLAGGLAKLLMPASTVTQSVALTPGKDPGGCIITIILGIAGALLGTWLGRVLHLYGPNEQAGFIGAVIGAFVILLLYRLIARRRRF